MGAVAKVPRQSACQWLGEAAVEAALVAGRLLLAAVFATAAISKIRDVAGTRQAVADFGVSPRLAPAVGALLPLAELTVAVTLVPSASVRLGATGALVLLAVFCIAIAVVLARGKKPDCRCFGQLHSSPVGWRTLSRNAALAAVAGFVLWRGWDHPGPNALAWLGDLSLAALVAILGPIVLICIAVQSWFLLHLLRQNGRILMRLDSLEAAAGGDIHRSSSTDVSPGPGLPVGTSAPEFTLPGLHGETLTLGALRARGLPVILLFTDPGCGPCTALMPEIGQWQGQHGARATIAVLSRGDAAVNRMKAEEAGVHNVLLQEGFEVAEAYHFGGTPSAVVVDVGGRIASPVAAGAGDIRTLIDRTFGAAPRIPVRAEDTDGDGAPHHHGRAQSLDLGQPAPELGLADLDGNIVDLRAYAGRATVVLFWDPACGFCQRMLPNLKAWEARATANDVQLLVVSSGSAESNRAMGLRSTVVVDDGARAMRRFGANGTPMAVLVDADGLIASPLRAGQEEVLSLLAPEEEVSATAT